ncbi:DUF262 domain-containing protein [Rathayibacter sp. VKM Ac-2801]|uniref:DUF262 domain-containing protein n=1 Tax=Rathayibacter sp. VKM Ac-2801 TaxID=2609255 RepID=UPI00131F7200|nr:DUF262 domain-containing protein [Rathayibacter sp. VKM Ac-2801]QHC70495.1 DUF262 domain-containing protein [Rathayibacter sp. VKM Ac-2801]
MEDPTKLSIGLKGIGHILRDQSLEVPAYQRNYAWGLEQVDEYWFDLLAALSADQPFYFLGTVVVGKSQSGLTSVIDGQQRLATTSMLIAAIREQFTTHEDTGRAETIQRQYLAAPSLFENRILPKLRLNAVDQHYFEQKVLGLSPVQPQSARLEIERAYDRLNYHLERDIQSVGPRWEDRLLRWIRLLEDKAQLIVVAVADDADAFVIFETLNDRGLELSVADLIKNYLLGLSRSNIDIAQDEWVRLVQTIEQVATSKEVTNFIRQWWNSSNGATRERDLYRSLRKKVFSETSALNTLEGLATSAPLYSALLDADHYLWGDHDPRTRKTVALLLEFGLEQYRPLALAALEHLPTQTVDTLLRAVLNWSTRGIIGGGIGGGTAERVYAEAAVRVRNGRAESVRHILHEVFPIVASDREFETAFTSRRILRTNYLRYFLRSLASEDAVEIEAFNDCVPIGLFPRSDPSGFWLGVVEEDLRVQLSSRIGNFALIRAQESANVPVAPEDRLKFLAEHDKMPEEYRLWNSISERTINERQRLMAARAVSVWPSEPLGGAI